MNNPEQTLDIVLDTVDLNGPDNGLDNVPLELGFARPNGSRLTASLIDGLSPFRLISGNAKAISVSRS